MAHDAPLPAGRRAPRGTIPVWSRSIGSWRISIGRKPFAADELERHYDKASTTWQTTISKLGFEEAYADLIDQAINHGTPLPGHGPLQVLDAGIATGAMSAAFASQCRSGSSWREWRKRCSRSDMKMRVIKTS